MEFDRIDWPAPAGVYLSRDLSAYLDYSGYRLPNGGVSTFDVATRKRIAVFEPTPESDSPSTSQSGLSVLLSNLLLLKGGRLGRAVSLSGTIGRVS